LPSPGEGGIPAFSGVFPVFSTPVAQQSPPITNMELISILAETGSVTAELQAVGENLKSQFGLHGQLLFSQVIGFLVFAFLLKKFAFGPIQQMLDQRKMRIAEGEELQVGALQIRLEKPDTVHSICVGNDRGTLTHVALGEPNLRLTFDGETGKLKTAEVL
jgi:hypothetical protein